MGYEFVIMAVEDVSALLLYKIPNRRVYPEEVGNNKKRVEILENEPLIKIATFYFCYVKAFG